MRVLRQARSALEAVLAAPGTEEPVTGIPPPRATFRVEEDRLWARVVIVEWGRRQVDDRQVAAIWAAVIGAAQITFDIPFDCGAWDSIYLVGPCPSPDAYPPPPRLDPS